MSLHALPALFTMLLAAAQPSLGAETGADPATAQTFRTADTRTLDYTKELYIRLEAPPGRSFCFPKGASSLAREGLFVPLLPGKCEDIRVTDAPPQVRITLHPNAVDDEWLLGQAYCSVDLHDMDDSTMDYTDLGRVNGLRAQGCVSSAPTSEHEPGYYGNAVTLFNGIGDVIAGAHYRIVAVGAPQYRAQLDALLQDVLKGVHPTPVPK